MPHSLSLIILEESLEYFCATWKDIFILLKVLFNTKKDRVIHHGTYVPTANMISENMEEEEASPKVLSPCEPIPPPIVTATPKIDVKQPDSSNGNEDIVDQTLPPERVLSPEKSTPPHTGISSEIQETGAAGKNMMDNITDVAESIQVDEISSSEILEETGESENKIVDEAVKSVVKSVSLEDEKQPTSERNETEARHDNVQFSTQSNAQKSEQFNKLKELLVETGVSDVTSQNALPSANGDVQPITLVGSKLCQSDGVVPVEINGRDDGETRNDVVLNGPRHKQLQQHPLFPTTTPNIRSIKRRHSLNSQSRNAYADVAPSDPKTYVSIKSRYKIPSAKSSVAGDATNENMLKNTSNRQTSGGNAAATVGNKRRHSAIAQVIDGGCGMQQHEQHEPCAKRRTRSEDRPSLTDENNPANQVTEDASSRLSWPTSDSTLSKNNGATATLSGQDRLSSSSNSLQQLQRRSLGKKATLVKTIRRPSISGSNRLQQLRGSFGLRDWDQGRSSRTGNCNDRRLNRTVAIISSTDTTMPQRWLRLAFNGYLLSPYQTGSIAH